MSKEIKIQMKNELSTEQEIQERFIEIIKGMSAEEFIKWMKSLLDEDDEDI